MGALMKPLRSKAVEQKTLSSPLRIGAQAAALMRQLRYKAVEQKTLSSP
jgi:hypothetical protein